MSSMIERSRSSTLVGSPPNFYPFSLVVVGVAWLALAIDLFMRFNIPTAIPILRANYGWSALTVGWVDSAYLWAYALVQVPWGYVSERWLHGRLTIVLGTMLMVGASLVFAFHVENLALAIASRALIGAGAGAIAVATTPVLARWFSPRVRGLQSGLLITGAPIGAGIGGAAMPILLTSGMTLFGLSTLQTGFVLSSIPGMALIVVVILFFRNRPEEIGLPSLDQKVEGGSPSISSIDEPSFGLIMLRSPYPYLLTGAYSGFVGAKYFVWTWFAVFLIKHYHLNIHSAGFVWGFVVAVPPILMLPLGGWISDRYSRVRCAVIALLITALLSGALAVISLAPDGWVPLWLLIVIASLFGIFGFMWVIVWPLSTIMFPTAASGAIIGFMNTFAQLLGAAAPIVSGFLIDRTGSYTSVFIGGALCALLGSGCAALLKNHRIV